jgi:hypothetical protein
MTARGVGIVTPDWLKAQTLLALEVRAFEMNSDSRDPLTAGVLLRHSSTMDPVHV